MACMRIEHGFICGPDYWVNMKPYGACVWMEWHNYHGPTFYRSESALNPIKTPSKKTWEAFTRWLLEK
jgi:hypothetical protein